MTRSHAIDDAIFEDPLSSRSKKMVCAIDQVGQNSWVPRHLSLSNRVIDTNGLFDCLTSLALLVHGIGWVLRVMSWMRTPSAGECMT